MCERVTVCLCVCVRLCAGSPQHQGTTCILLPGQPAASLASPWQQHYPPGSSGADSTARQNTHQQT